jgi:palmitoyltransferase
MAGGSEDSGRGQTIGKSMEAVVTDQSPSTQEDSKKKRTSCCTRCAMPEQTRHIYRLIDFAMEVVSFMARYVVGPALICLAISLISFVTYTYFVHLMPLKAEEGWSLARRSSATALGLFLLLNALYNYFKTVTSSSGEPPEYEQALREADEESARYLRKCRRCTKLKPERCHHCSICKKCVLKMDHHCPWINNCVGHGNYRHFCLFMLFVAASCVFSCSMFFSLFHEITFNPRQARRKSTWNGRQCIATSFMISGSIFTALCILGGFHVILVATNQTTIEFQLNIVGWQEARKKGQRFRLPYYISLHDNFQQVFGPNRFFGFLWLMPYLSQSPTGDGMSFPIPTDAD